MADEVVQGLLLVGWAMLLALATTALFRRSILSFRYWLGWLALAALQLVAALVAVLAPRDVEVLGLSPVSWVAVGFVAVSLLVAVQLSISISGQQKMLVTVGQECAELRSRIEMMETERSIAPPTYGDADDGA